MKRLISILLVVSMIFVMLSAQGFVSYGSTTNTMENTGLPENEQKSIWGKDETVSIYKIPEISSELVETVEIKNAGERCYYKFTPTESGAYKYYSDSMNSIYGAIRDDTFKILDEGDNYVTDFYYPELRGDFGIIHIFEAGKTYYLESYIAMGGTGTYNMGLVKVPKATAVDISYIGYREYGSEITFSAKFTPVDCEPEAVTWTSSNPEVVEVDKYGNALCKGVGTAIITVTTSGGLSAEKEIVVEDCDEIKTSEKETYTVLFESNYRYKFVPEVSGVYTFSFDRDNWVFFMVASLRDAQLEKIVSVNNEDDTFDCTLTAGETYYLEIDANSGDVMCWASVTVELKEEIIEVTAPPTETPTIDQTHESEFEYEILDNGKAVITKYKGTDVSVIIPDELDGYTISAIGAYSFANNENLKNIWIPESVTVIEENAFHETRPGGVFYPGSKDKWDDISIGDGNIYLKGAIHFYNFDSTVPDGDDPVIGLSAFSDIANKNEQYVIRVDAYNLTSLEQAEVVLKYNPEVLKLNLDDSVMMYEERLYVGGYKLLSEGNIQIGVSRDENWIQYDADSIIGFNLYFDVIGIGNTDLTVELENVNYRSDSRLKVLSSNFARLAEDGESEPEPTDTICPTETPTPEVTITPTPTCIYPSDTPEPLETLTPEPTEDIKPTETENIPVPWEALGDVNIDGDINAEDALLVLKHAAKLEILTGQSMEVADTTEDDNVDAEDALKILKKAAKLIEEL